MKSRPLARGCVAIGQGQRAASLVDCIRELRNLTWPEFGWMDG